MWERAGLKYNAKQELRQYYWVAFAVCLVGGILGGSGVGGGGSASSSFTFSRSSTSSVRSGGYSYNYSGIPDATAGVIILVVVLVMVAVAVAFIAFVSNPISVGISTWFIAAPRGYRSFDILFHAFRGGRYLSTVKTMFLTDLYIFLWSLLLIIPGIIKSYQYRMVPYLISDHPYLTPDEAMAISKQMTEGQKMDMFVLDLSFIGWYLLGTLALGLGVLFVNPYAEATWAQLYFVQKQYVQVPPPPMPLY